jgi:hypothetical protein
LWHNFQKSEKSFVIFRRLDPLAVAIDDVFSPNAVFLIDMRTKDDLSLDNLFAKAALVKLRRAMHDLEVLPSGRHVLEQLVAAGAPAAAVRVGSQEQL